MAPFLEPQDITYTPRIATRRSGSVPGVMAQRLSVALKGGGRTQLRAGTSLRGTPRSPIEIA
jgi:hypothetical protein